MNLSPSRVSGRMIRFSPVRPGEPAAQARTVRLSNHWTSNSTWLGMRCAGMCSWLRYLGASKVSALTGSFEALGDRGALARCEQATELLPRRPFTSSGRLALHGLNERLLRQGILMAAIGVDGNGDKHVLAVVEGATENTVVVQALIDNLLARGLDPTLPRLFIVDGAKALSKAIRNTFGVAAAIQRCQVHKGRNIIERLPQHLHASVKKALRQAWDQDDANKAERLLRNLVRRLEHEEPGVSGSILEGLDEILTVIRLGLPHELRRSLACTNIVENALGTVRQVTRNVKRWRHAEMALRWTAAGLLEAQKTFRRLKAYRQLPILRNALQEHLRKAQADSAIETIMKAA